MSQTVDEIEANVKFRYLLGVVNIFFRGGLATYACHFDLVPWY